MTVLRRARRAATRLRYRAVAAAKGLAGDVLWLLSVGLLAHGLGLYSPPLELIVWGVALMFAVAYGSGELPRRRRR